MYKTLSACLIVKDEELVIERCLTPLVECCDEIIVVDTGSSDSTVSVVLGLMEVCPKIRLEHFDWIMDYSAARNYSFSLSHCEYLMWIDADEVFTQELVNEIKTWKNSELPYKVLSTHIKFGETLINRPRIIHRDLDPHWKYNIHEKLEYDCDNAIPFTFTALVIHERLKPSLYSDYTDYYYLMKLLKKFSNSSHNLYYAHWTLSNTEPALSNAYAYRFIIKMNSEFKEGTEYGQFFNIQSNSEFKLAKMIKVTGVDTELLITLSRQPGYQNITQALCWLYTEFYGVYSEEILTIYISSLFGLGLIAESKEINDILNGLYPNAEVTKYNNRYFDILMNMVLTGYDNSFRTKYHADVFNAVLINKGDKVLNNEELKKYPLVEEGT